MNKAVLALAAGVSVALAAAPAQATTINFDSLGDGVVVTNQYAGVTFSSSAGEQVVTSAQSLGSSLPNFICTAATGGGLDCVNDVYIDFASAVSGLSFLQVGDNASGDIGDVRVFSGATLLGTVDIIGDNNSFLANLVDLTAFSGITRIEIANITDPAGLGYDDFTFTAAVGGVPEPSTWAMMLLGFGAIGVAMRRRKAAARPAIA